MLLHRTSMITHTNTLFCPRNPRAEAIKLEDIAHALAHMCRAAGHIRHFYSAAQHGLNCAYEGKSRGMSEKIQLACLLYNGTEAYLSDTANPVAISMEEYPTVEQRLQQVIFNAFGIRSLTEAERGQLVEIDDALLAYELLHLQPGSSSGQLPSLQSCPDVSQRDAAKVKQEFIQYARILMENLGVTSGKSVGIDSCKQGWAVFWQEGAGEYDFAVYPHIAPLLSEHREAATLLIDIPIGLPESAEMGLHRPDQELRNKLVGKASSVFNTPCRQAVYAEDKHAARRYNLQVLGKSLSEQSLGFSKKIKEVDLFLEACPEYIGRLRESHPELCFALLNQGLPLISRKTEPEGMAERIAVLSRYFPQAESAFIKIQTRQLQSQWNDFVDAMVLAVTGQIGLSKGFLTIPRQPWRDKREIPMEVVYSFVE